MIPSLLMISETAAEAIAAAMANGAHAFKAPQASDIQPVVSGGVATIPVKGALFAEPSWIHALFGLDCTTYSGLGDALARANNDPRVSSIRLAVDSPGGDMKGLYEFMDAVASSPKRVDAEVVGDCCSAAYGIASQCASITSSSDGNTIGSVGVRTVAMRPDGRVVHVTSSAAPKKVPDAGTDEGISAIREYLDQQHELFAGRIARGRGTTVDAVNTGYGQGGVMTAASALRLGMIDHIKTTAPRGSAHGASAGGANGSESHMDLKELKAAHPLLCAELVAEGVAQERERVAAHVQMGKEFGCTELSLQHIEAGADFGPKVTAAYIVAGNRSRELAARDADGAPQVNAEAPVAADPRAAEDAKIVATYDSLYGR